MITRSKRDPKGQTEPLMSFFEMAPLPHKRPTSHPSSAIETSTEQEPPVNIQLKEENEKMDIESIIDSPVVNTIYNFTESSNDSSQADPASQDKSERPITRRMSKKTGHEPLAWIGDVSTLPCNQKDLSAFIVGDDELLASQDDLYPAGNGDDVPGQVNSWAFSEPTLAKEKEARMSALEKLRDARQNRTKSNAAPRYQDEEDHAPMDTVEYQAPIFLQNPESESIPRTSYPQRYQQSGLGRHTSPTKPNEALEVRRKRSRNPDSTGSVLDWLGSSHKPSITSKKNDAITSGKNEGEERLPSFSSDFIEDDGYGYGPDPIFLSQGDEPTSTTYKPQIENITSSSTFMPSSATFTSSSKPSRSTSTNFSSPKKSRTTTPLSTVRTVTHSSHLNPFSRSIPAPNVNTYTDAQREAQIQEVLQGFEHYMDDEDAQDMPVEVPRNQYPSTPTSVGNSSFTSGTTSQFHAAQNIPNAGMSNSFQIRSDPSLPVPSFQKMRVSITIKDKKFLVSISQDSTIMDLQNEASKRYTELSKIKVEIDEAHLPGGALLMADDKIGDVLRDLENVTCLIKESKPLDMIALYKGDCIAKNIPNLSVLSQRLIAMEDTAHVQAIDLANLGLDSLTLPSLYSIFNLYSIPKIDLSENQIDSVSFLNLLIELRRDDNSATHLNVSSNMLGPNFPLDVVQRVASVLTNLKSLDLSWNILNDDAIANFIPLLTRYSTSLLELNLQNNFFGSKAVLEWVSQRVNLERLVKLDVSRNPIGPAGLEALVACLEGHGAAAAPQLQHLDISYCNIFSDPANQSGAQFTVADKTMDRIAKFPHLTQLSLRGNFLGTKTSHHRFPTICIGLKHLLYLDLSHCGLTMSDLYILRMLLASTLTSLDLSNNFFGPESAIALANDFVKPPTENLKVLKLVGCGLGQECCNHLQLIATSNRNLTLDLRDN